MNIQECINKLKTAKTNIIASIKNKGVSIPDDTSISDISTYIDSITGGYKFKDLSGFYAVNRRLNDIAPTDLDYSNVVKMEECFNASDITSIDVTDMNLSKVEEMQYCFGYCDSLRNIVGKVSCDSLWNASGMFMACESLIDNPFEHFDMKNVTNLSIFMSSSKVTSIDLSAIGGNGQWIEMPSMCSNCQLLTSVTYSKNNQLKLTSYGSVFSSCGALQEIDLYGVVSDCGDVLFGTYSSITSLRKVFVPQTISVMKGTPSWNNPSLVMSFLYGASPDCVVYTDATEQLPGWSDAWNVCNSNGDRCQVIYGATHDDYLNA